MSIVGLIWLIFIKPDADLGHMETEFLKKYLSRDNSVVVTAICSLGRYIRCIKDLRSTQSKFTTSRLNVFFRQPHRFITVKTISSKAKGFKPTRKAHWMLSTAGVRERACIDSNDNCRSPKWTTYQCYNSGKRIYLKKHVIRCIRPYKRPILELSHCFLHFRYLL